MDNNHGKANPPAAPKLVRAKAGHPRGSGDPFWFYSEKSLSTILERNNIQTSTIVAEINEHKLQIS
jgi:hypothetical protein